LSRLNEIITNHENLEHLFSIIKHHGVNAEFISQAILEHFQPNQEDENENSEQESDDQAKQLLEDLTQFNARF
jgi:sulfur relay (sulfurtransferase) DsrF/TusC family protein